MAGKNRPLAWLVLLAAVVGFWTLPSAPGRCAGPQYLSDLQHIADNYPWALQDIKEAVYWELMVGYPDGTFRPGQMITRAEFAVLLSRATGYRPDTGPVASFTDVSPSDWYAGDLGGLVREGIVEESKAFSGSVPITRLQAAVWLGRVAKKEGLPRRQEAIAFKDLPADTPSFGDVVAAVEAGIMQGGDDNRFLPDDLFSRAQAAAVIMRLSRQLEPIDPSDVSFFCDLLARVSELDTQNQLRTPRSASPEEADWSNLDDLVSPVWQRQLKPWWLEQRKKTTFGWSTGTYPLFGFEYNWKVEPKFVARNIASVNVLRQGVFFDEDGALSELYPLWFRFRSETSTMGPWWQQTKEQQDLFDREFDRARKEGVQRIRRHLAPEEFLRMEPDGKLVEIETQVGRFEAGILIDWTWWLDTAYLRRFPDGKWRVTYWPIGAAKYPHATPNPPPGYQLTAPPPEIVRRAREEAARIRPPE